jgi:CIC family chloride channel protein
VLLLEALLVGLASGGAAVLLRFAATALPRLVWPAAPDMMDAVAAAPAVRRIAIPVAGALVAGLILELGHRWAGSARGWDILEAVLLRNGVLPMRPALIKSASSLVTVASAGAVGREGPIVLVAAAVVVAFGPGRWTPYVGLLVPLVLGLGALVAAIMTGEFVGQLTEIGKPGVFVGSLMHVVGLVAAVAGGVGMLPGRRVTVLGR